jgi:uncharacterized protein YgiM (DUF1202 family)
MRKIGKVVLLSTGLLIGGTVIPYTPINLMKAEASSTFKINHVNYETIANLNLRTGASTKNKVIVTIPKKKTVIASEKKGNWFKVAYTYSSKGKKMKKSGWVSGTYLKEYYKYSKTGTTYYFTKKTTHLYSTPDTKRKAVYILPSGNGLSSNQKVLNSVNQLWYKVAFNGKTFYVPSNDVTKYGFKTFTKTFYQAKKDTYIYSSFGNKYSKLVKVPKGTIVYSSQGIASWNKGTWNGKSGYFYINDFSKYMMPAEVKLSDEKSFLLVSDVAVKQYPDQSSITLATIQEDIKIVPISKTVNSWYKVAFAGKTGYVIGSNLQEVNTVEPVVESPTEEPLAAATYLVTANLNLRQDASSSSTILAVLPKGTFVIPTLKDSNGWYKVSYNGKMGYVYGDYIQQVKTGAPLGNRDSYQFIDLQTQSLVTATQINNYIASYVKLTGKTSVLSGKGQDFIDAGEKYGVNALYLAAHSIHESAYGTSTISLGKNNLFGFGSYDADPYIASYRFPSVQSCIDYIAREIKSTYLNPGNWKYKGSYLGFSTKTLNNTRIDDYSEGMNFYYASDPNWGKAIANHMENILPYDKSYYEKADVNTVIPTRPTVPGGRDVFPNQINAIAKTDLVLDSKKGINDHVTTIKKGTSFILSEKTNDYWTRIKVGEKEYWTNDIQFDKYSTYLSVQNLGRVTATALNVRTGPSTSYSIIGSFNLNDYVQLMLNKDDTLVMDNLKAWYQVKLPNGTIGWASLKYINRELR